MNVISFLPALELSAMFSSWAFQPCGQQIHSPDSDLSLTPEEALPREHRTCVVSRGHTCDGYFLGTYVSAKHSAVRKVEKSLLWHRLGYSNKDCTRKRNTDVQRDVENRNGIAEHTALTGGQQGEHMPVGAWLGDHHPHTRSLLVNNIVMASFSRGKTNHGGHDPGIVPYLPFRRSPPAPRHLFARLSASNCPLNPESLCLPLRFSPRWIRPLWPPESFAFQGSFSSHLQIRALFSEFKHIYTLKTYSASLFYDLPYCHS